MQVFITVVVGLLSAADRSSLTRAPLHTITTIEGQTCSNASNGTRVYTIVLLSKHSNQRTQHFPSLREKNKVTANSVQVHDVCVRLGVGWVEVLMVALARQVCRQPRQ